jgi:integrase
MSRSSSRAAQGIGTIRKKTVTRNGKPYTYWEARITTGRDPGTGKQIQKSFSGKTQKEVREKMQAAAVEINEGDYFEPSKITVSQWLDVWINEYCVSVKYGILKHYRAQCETHIKPALGAVKLSKLTTPQIQAFYNELGKTGHTITKKDQKTGNVTVTKQPLSTKSIKNIHCILSKCLNTAIEIGYLRDNPAGRAKLPKVEKKEISPLTDDQVKALLKELEAEEYGDLFRVILFTGLRESEAIGLTWDCIDFETGVLKINKQLQKRPAKDGGYTFAPLKNDKTRFLTVPPFVMQTLKDHRAAQLQDRFTAGDQWHGYQNTKEQKTALVFTNAYGEPLNPKAVYLHYKKLAAKIDAPESRVHDLRHTYAVLSLQNGDDVKTVQGNLGHATAAFTLDVYGHVSEKMKTDSAARMQAYIEKIE